MSVTSFIEKIVGLQQQRAQAKVAGYRELIATIAAGQEPNPAEVERLLADAGKSLDDLQRDVELCQRRLGFKAAVAAMPKLEAERKSLDDQIAAADRVLEAAEKQHRDKTAPLYFRRRQIDEALSAGSTAVGELVRTCEDPDLLREMDELNAEDHRLSNVRFNLDGRESRLRAHANRERAQADHQLILSDAKHHRELADRFDKEADVLRRELEKLDQTRSEFAQRREQIEARMREV